MTDAKGEGSTTVCDLCGGGASDFLLAKSGSRYLRCRGCGFVYSDLDPEDSRLANEDYFAAELDRYVAKAYSATRQKRYSLRLKPFRPYRKLGRLLEIGANVGGFLHRARAEGWQAVGVEPVAACAEWARRERGLDVRTSVLEEAGLEEASFDGAFSNAVFEHLRHPSRVFAELRRVLRPGGLAVIDTVNWESYTRERIGAAWKLVDPRVHLCLYGPATLRAHCEKAGLEVLAIRTRGVRFLPNEAPRPRGIMRVLDELRKAPFSALARITKKGDSIAVWARRPVETRTDSRP